jgi:hypothetical protein
MTAEIVEAEIVPEVPETEIVWAEMPPERPAIAPPPGKHRKPEVSESITDEPEAPEIPESPPREPPRTRPAGRRRAIRDRVPPVPTRGRAKNEKDGKVPPPNVRPPDFAEWHDYVGNFALKWISRGYIAWVFRGVDRYELLSKADNEALQMDDEQLSDISKPIAHLAARSKVGGKYGRVIIDSSDGVLAMIAMGMWANRVNRIAKKYKMGERNGEAQPASGQDVSGEPEGEPAANGYSARNPIAAPNGFGYN